MLSDGLTYLIRLDYWWLIYPAGIVIIMTVMASTSLATRCATPSRPGCSAGRERDLVAPLLEISDLRTEIRLRQGVVHAVDGVSLHVEPGETLGIVGESGCGKTMTALSIMNLLPTGGSIVGGSIKLDGQELSTLSDDDMRRSAATRSA